jgi:hypothetical protein
VLRETAFQPHNVALETSYDSMKTESLPKKKKKKKTKTNER